METSPREIDLPFRFDALGRVAFTTDRSRQAANHVASIIGTVPGERVMRNTYGAGVSAVVFEPGEGALSMIELAVREGIQRWATDVRLDSVSGNPSRIEEGVVDVQVNYSVVQNPQPVRYRATISEGGEVREVTEIG